MEDDNEVGEELYEVEMDLELLTSLQEDYDTINSIKDPIKRLHAAKHLVGRLNG